MRNIVPGSIMTAEWWYCQRNQVSLPEESVEECFARFQFMLTIRKRGCGYAKYNELLLVVAVLRFGWIVFCCSCKCSAFSSYADP
jgi:hypothetical protein